MPAAPRNDTNVDFFSTLLTLNGVIVRFFDSSISLILARAPRRTNYARILRHLGAFGLFALAILDSTPLPTFGGTDILTVVLAGRRAEPWYYYAAMATVGSVIGAVLTYHLAKAAGSTYLEKKFGAQRVAAILRLFERWGTSGLALSTLLPLPSPTTALFAAAGILNYPWRKFIAVVGLARAARYFTIAAIASHYGRHFVRVFLHPVQYAGWWLLIASAALMMAATALLVRRRLEAAET